MESQSHPDPQASPPGHVGHEVRDVYAAPVALSALGLATLVAASFAAMLLLFNVLARQQAEQTAVPSPLAGTYGMKEPPEPRLQNAPLLDLFALRVRDAAALGEYAWVDRDAGVVRIPIERAIAVLAERGLPARPAPKEKP